MDLKQTNTFSSSASMLTPAASITSQNQAFRGIVASDTKDDEEIKTAKISTFENNKPSSFVGNAMQLERNKSAQDMVVEQLTAKNTEFDISTTLASTTSSVAAAAATNLRTIVVPGPGGRSPFCIEPLARRPRVRYALHKRLCHSIFGEVYMGTDKLTMRKVAVKVSVRELLNRRVSRNEVKVLEDPTHEAEMMKIVGPNRCIVGFVDTHEEEKLHWLVLEYVSGGELFDLVVKHGRLPDDYARRFFQCLLVALRHMHSRGVCHLDLSLENLLLDHEGYVKVCDFGLARKFEAGVPFPGTQDCKPGKVNYMAPEILAGKEFEGPTADLFSAGVILFTMLTGHPPFQAATMEDERYKLIATGQISQLLHMLRMSDRVCGPARDLITRLLSPNPSKRLTAEKMCGHPWVLKP